MSPVSFALHEPLICFFSAGSPKKLDRENPNVESVEWNRLENLEFQTLDIEAEVVDAGPIEGKEDRLQGNARNDEVRRLRVVAEYHSSPLLVEALELNLHTRIRRVTYSAT